MDYGGSSAPAGWLLCDGSAVSRTTYARLFAALGTTFGAGDGSTTFNLPDLRGRVAVGAGQGAGLTNRALAATGGEETHALSVAELAAHNHGITDPGHNHTQNLHNHGITDPGHNHGITDPGHSHTVYISQQAAGGGLNNVPVSSASAIPPTTSNTTGVSVNTNTTGVSVNTTTATNNAATTGVTTTNTGSGTGHNTMPPFGVLNKIIKI